MTAEKPKPLIFRDFSFKRKPPNTMSLNESIVEDAALS